VPSGECTKDSAKPEDLPANGGLREGNSGVNSWAEIRHSVSGRFPGSSFIMSAQQPATIDQNTFNARDDHRI
jgi:hypothetical protein